MEVQYGQDLLQRNSKAMSKVKCLVAIFVLFGCQADQEESFAGEDSFAGFCTTLPVEENAKLTLSSASDDWFQVYEVADNVFSIVEPYQFQQSISHLILGSERAILFDTGIGMRPIRPVVERITDLPVTVLNSHTHYDHVGGNYEFSSVMAIDSEYTRANMSGFEHSRIADEFVPDAICPGTGLAADIDEIYTRSWQASDYVEDGDILELGNRKIEILHVPGHTPDATALLDAENGLLFTGDTFYDAELWLFVPETSFDDYDRAIDRLASIEGSVDYLLGAHLSARVSSGRLTKVRDAFRKIRAGNYSSSVDSIGRTIITVDGIEFVTSEQALAGRQGDITKGGSGLDIWE